MPTILTSTIQQDDDSFDDSYEALIRLSERLGSVKPKGVSVDKLSAMKRFRYADWPLVEKKGGEISLGGKGKGRAKDGEEEGKMRLAVKGVDKESRCSICLTVRLSSSSSSTARANFDSVGAGLRG